MTVTVTGGSGLIGRELIARLLSGGHEVVSLGRAPRTGVPSAARLMIWDSQKGSPPAESLEGVGAVVHLAGEPVAQRWSQEAKRRIRASRVEATRRLVDGIRAARSRPKALVCASAVGYYGDRGDEILAETSKPGAGFLPEICVDWEKQAIAARTLDVRVVIVRIGLVLARHGGALDRMLPAFRAGAGGRLGSGEQWMSWIHLNDLVRLFERTVTDESVSGVWNGVAPNPVTNADFTRALGRALHRPALLPVPRFAIQLLFGQMGEILFHSQRAMPEGPRAAGFEFEHPEVFAAFKDLLGRP